MKLSKPTTIDEDRFMHGNPTIIRSFFSKHGDLIANTPKCLLFGADETMLEPSKLKKVGLPSDITLALQRGILNMPHITAMCAHNVVGVAVPLFIILKDLHNLPDDLKEYAESGQAWFGSSPSAYMTRDLFMVWTICFINWLSGYRLTLPSSI